MSASTKPTNTTAAQKRLIIFTVTNLFIFITMIIAVITVLTYGSRAGRIDNTGFPSLGNILTFTVLSNIFLGLVAGVAAIYGYWALRAVKTSTPMAKSLTTATKSTPTKSLFPRPLATFYLAAATAGMITFLTVIFFLAPARALRGQNYFDMLLEPMFFLHFLNPLLGAMIYIFGFAAVIDYKATLRDRLLAMLPILVYAVPYILFVAVFKLWPDFYGLTFGGRYYLLPLVFAAFCLLSFAISSLLVFFQNKISKNYARK